jgi:hypothetical protein
MIDFLLFPQVSSKYSYIKIFNNKVVRSKDTDRGELTP